MQPTLARVIAIASMQSGIPEHALWAGSAIDQDLGMSGGDVTAFVETLAREFGDEVWQWPWQRFALLDEGLSLLFTIMLIWQLLTWPFRGLFEYPNPYERLDLGHIARAIENGQWVEP